MRRKSVGSFAPGVFLLLGSIFIPQPSLSQDSEPPVSGSRRGIHLSLGFGSGPSPTGSLAVRLLRGHSTQRRLYLEYSRWASGVAVTCDQSWPESYSCDVDGHNLFGGLSAEIDSQARLRPYADIGAGLVLRRKANGRRHGAVGFEIGTGLRFRAGTRVSWRLGLRWMEVFDAQYRDLMGEPLRVISLGVGMEIFGPS